MNQIDRKDALGRCVTEMRETVRGRGQTTRIGTATEPKRQLRWRRRSVARTLRTSLHQPGSAVRGAGDWRNQVRNNARMAHCGRVAAGAAPRIGYHGRGRVIVASIN